MPGVQLGDAVQLSLAPGQAAGGVLGPGPFPGGPIQGQPGPGQQGLLGLGGHLEGHGQGLVRRLEVLGLGQATLGFQAGGGAAQLTQIEQGIPVAGHAIEHGAQGRFADGEAGTEVARVMLENLQVQGRKAPLGGQEPRLSRGGRQPPAQQEFGRLDGGCGCTHSVPGLPDEQVSQVHISQHLARSHGQGLAIGLLCGGQGGQGILAALPGALGQHLLSYAHAVVEVGHGGIDGQRPVCGRQGGLQGGVRIPAPLLLAECLTEEHLALDKVGDEVPGSEALSLVQHLQGPAEIPLGSCSTR